jgi:hypothetical protein
MCVNEYSYFHYKPFSTMTIMHHLERRALEKEFILWQLLDLQ